MDCVVLSISGSVAIEQASIEAFKFILSFYIFLEVAVCWLQEIATVIGVSNSLHGWEQVGIVHTDLLSVLLLGSFSKISKA